MLSDPIDLRLYLPEGDFTDRALRSRAWARYLQLPSIPPFDEAAALAEIAQRNAVRTETRLPLLDSTVEIARMRQAYDSRTFADRFYELAAQCVTEIYGPIKASDFNSMSSLRGFMAEKQNLIRRLIQKQGGSGRRR